MENAWQEALSSDLTQEDPDYDSVHRSGLVSIRYALITQLLGKFADSSRDALCLQRGKIEDAKEEGRWDPRSFCSAVIVPWVQSADGVLGTNVYFSQLHELIRVAFTFAGERARTEFLQEIGAGINKLAVQPTLRVVWSNLLIQMGSV